MVHEHSFVFIREEEKQMKSEAIILSFAAWVIKIVNFLKLIIHNYIFFFISMAWFVRGLCSHSDIMTVSAIAVMGGIFVKPKCFWCRAGQDLKKSRQSCGGAVWWRRVSGGGYSSYDRGGRTIATAYTQLLFLIPRARWWGCVNLDMPHKPSLPLATRIHTAIQLTSALRFEVWRQMFEKYRHYVVWKKIHLPAGDPGHPVWLSREGGVRILTPRTPSTHKEKIYSSLLINLHIYICLQLLFLHPPERWLVKVNMCLQAETRRG